MQKDERRTGACMLVKSGTVGDDPFVFIERQIGRICLDSAQRDFERTGNMAPGIGVSPAYIYDHRFAAIECSFGLIDRYARDLSVIFWQIGWRLCGCRLSEDRLSDLGRNKDLSRNGSLVRRCQVLLKQCVACQRAEKKEESHKQNMFCSFHITFFGRLGVAMATLVA